MVFLIGFTGLSGSGKTTAINYLQRLSAGQKIYLGATVLQEVERRGLRPGPESERQVRLELRQQHGRSAFVNLARSDIEGYLSNGTNVLVDAILTREEYQALQTCRGEAECLLIAIEASFDARCERLRLRTSRPMTREELESRDKTEVTNLGIMMTKTMADHTVVNEGSMEAFEQALQSVWRKLTA